MIDFTNKHMRLFNVFYPYSRVFLGNFWEDHLSHNYSKPYMFNNEIKFLSDGLPINTYILLI